MTAFLMEHVAIGGLIFVAVYALRSLVLFPATLLTIISGIVFGPVWGSVYAFFGANISAAISYTIGKSATADPDAQSSLSGIRDYLSGNAFQSVLIGRFIFLPFDIMNFASGVLRIPYMPFALATAIGILPGTIAFVLAGASLDAPAYFKTMDIVINSTVLYASLFLISVSFLISYLLKK
jgi:uncharacterized membrane protein YdjX (TVP38/TMEM64 family)